VQKQQDQIHGLQDENDELRQEVKQLRAMIEQIVERQSQAA